MNLPDSHLELPRSTPIPVCRAFVSVFRWVFTAVMLAWGTLHLQAQGDSSVVTNAASAVPTGVTFSINGLPKPQDVDTTIQIVGALTLLSLAPSLLMLMTSFPRIIIVFSLAKNALGVASAIPSQLVMGFSLILTFFIMRPVIRDIETTALAPYRTSQITSTEALNAGEVWAWASTKACRWAAPAAVFLPWAMGSPPVKVTPSSPASVEIAVSSSSRLLSRPPWASQVSWFQQPGQWIGQPCTQTTKRSPGPLARLRAIVRASRSFTG